MPTLKCLRRQLREGSSLPTPTLFWRLRPQLKRFLVDLVNLCISASSQMAGMDLGGKDAGPLVSRLDTYYEDPDLVKGKVRFS